MFKLRSCWWYGLPQNQEQGSTDRKVGPRGPKDPVRSGSQILEKADQGEPRTKKIFKTRTGRTADQWGKKSWSASYEYKRKKAITILKYRLLAIQETYTLGNWWSIFINDLLFSDNRCIGGHTSEWYIWLLVDTHWSLTLGHNLTSIRPKHLDTTCTH